MRTLHLLTTGVLLGGHVFAQPAERLYGWLCGSVISGLLLFATDLHASFSILFQVRGLLVLLKLLALVPILVFWEARVPFLVLALAIGAVGSHMPGRMRYQLWALRGRVAVDQRSG